MYMPAVSKAQARLFKLVHLHQQGKLSRPNKRIKSLAKSMSPEDVLHYAKTKLKGLPEHISDNLKVALYQGFMKRAEAQIVKEASPAARRIMELLASKKMTSPQLAGKFTDYYKNTNMLGTSPHWTANKFLVVNTEPISEAFQTARRSGNPVTSRKYELPDMMYQEIRHPNAEANVLSEISNVFKRPNQASIDSLLKGKPLRTQTASPTISIKPNEFEFAEPWFNSAKDKLSEILHKIRWKGRSSSETAGIGFFEELTGFRAKGNNPISIPHDKMRLITDSARKYVGF